MNQDFSRAFHLKLSSEFEKIDEFRDGFQLALTQELVALIKGFLPNIITREDFKELLQVYTLEVFSGVESVSYKDSNYSKIRLKEELDYISSAVEKRQDLMRNDEFANAIHRKAKEVIVRFHPNLIDLSADGFRLLEKYCWLYNHGLINFVYQLEKD